MASRLHVRVLFPIVSLACVQEPEPLPEFEANEDYYGPCFDEYGRTRCLPEEDACLTWPFDYPSHYVCTMPCDVASDCPDPPLGGSPEVACVDNTCLLRCDDTSPCPGAMQCPDETCLWDVYD